MEPTTIAKLGLSALELAYRKGSETLRARRFSTMLEQVARVSGTDPAAAAAIIEETVSQEWGAKLFEQTFRSLIDSIHSTAEVAIAAMMAEYVHACRGPDREYQLAGGLLAGSDDEVLRGLLAISLQFVELHRREPSARVHGSQVPDHYTIVRAPNNQLYAHRRSGTQGARVADDSAGQPCPTNIGIIVRLLERHEFGYLPHAIGYSPEGFRGPHHSEGGSAQLDIIAGAEDRLRRLHGYLLPALSASST